VNLILDENIKIPIKTIIKFWPKFKSLKFYLKPLDFGICYPKRKIVSTYFLCQQVDIIFTDKDNVILKICDGVYSERFVFKKRKTYYTYYLPVGASEYLNVGDKLNLVPDKKKKKDTK